MGVSQWTIGWVISLFALIMLNAFIFVPLQSDVFGSTDVEAGGTNRTNTSIGVAGACLTPGKTSMSETLSFIPLVGRVIGGVVDVTGDILKSIENLIFGTGGDRQPTGNSTACTDSLNILGGGSGVIGAAAILFLLGGATVLSGFLTGGASNSALATFGYAAIMASAVIAGLGLVYPFFAMIPEVGVFAFGFYAAVGFILVMHSGLAFLAGGGE